MTMSRIGLLASLRRLFGNRDGVTAVEMALVSPIFFAFMIGTMEVALVMFTNVAIEAAVRDAARYGITGSVPQGMTREAQLLEIIADRTLGLVSNKTGYVTTKVYPNFASVGTDEEFTDLNGDGYRDAGETYTDANGNGQWDPGEQLDDSNGNGVRDATEPYVDANNNGQYDGGTPGMGGSGQVVLYTISYQLPFIGPTLHELFGVKVLTLSTRIVVRNEPWASS